jgi:hypothetical protein
MHHGSNLSCASLTLPFPSDVGPRLHRPRQPEPPANVGTPPPKPAIVAFSVSFAANHLARQGGLAPLVPSTAIAPHLVTVSGADSHDTTPVSSAVIAR